MVKELARYWELGWVAFPITLKWNDSREKKELIPPKDWSKLTLETAQGLPARNAIAIQTGASSGIVVVDVDDVEGWQQILVEAGESAPETVTARSQRGGYHYYFQYTENVADLKSTSALLDGCADVRNQGGMIIAPPSAFQVLGESTPRTYSWFEGKSPWDRDLAEMPGWLVNALRSSRGGGTKRLRPNTVWGHGGPDTIATPDAVKDFIMESYSILPAYIGGTKCIGEGLGYAIATSILDCCFKKAAHQNNRQYFFVNSGGEMTRRCHDGDCREKVWGYRQVTSEILQILEGMFHFSKRARTNCGEETPSEVKKFITRSCGLEEETIGSTKLAPNSTGYIVTTSVRYCPIAKDIHRQGQQYFFLSVEGEMTRRCHDAECKEKIKRRK
ncbi:hypothetical protein HDU93_003604, partial [Gonapodya sp. JEL0774]